MKIFKKFSIVILTIAFVFSFTGLNVARAATNPNLGAAESFSVLAQTAITGIATISGNVGLNSTGAGITALTTGKVGGIIYSTDGVAPSVVSPFLSASVQANAVSANANMLSQGSPTIIGTPLDGLTLTPGVYDLGAGQLNGGVLHLNGAGVYIFRTSSSLVSSGSIDFQNGARACDLFWSVNSLATINGGSFAGTIIAGTGVHFGANTTLDGRALAVGGDVTMINNTITGPTCATPSPLAPALATLHVIKQVVNNNGGTATASAFNLHVKLSGTDVAGSPAAGTITPGTSYSLSAGTYIVSEDVNASYLQSFSGACDSSGSVTLSAGSDMTCTVTNDDIVSVVVPPTPTPAVITPAPIITPTAVPTPSLPKTGFPPQEKNVTPFIIVFAGISVVSISLYFVRKKQTT